ncbi:MAG: AAA domain-containing protein [bacterium]
MNEVSQINFNKEFINGLLNKLKVGNRRGIHLNALPGRFASRLDLSAFDAISPDSSLNFLQRLLSEERLSFEINFDNIDISKLGENQKNSLFLLSRKLNNIVYENEDQFLEFGIKNFGIGYPILIRRDTSDPTKVIKAPLLIWNLDIQKSANKTNSWIITRDENSPIVLNELLRSHVASDAQINLDQLSESLLEDNLINEKELIDICNNILSQLNVNSENSKLSIKLEPCPGKEKLDSLATDNVWIQWSAVFGIYKSRKESIIHCNEELLKKLEEFQNNKLVIESFQTSTVSSVKTDPSKEELINSFTDTEIKLIQGPPGTGKSQALTAIITNTLENGGRCLVVCEKKTALEVIYRNLKDVGLDQYIVIIDDVNKDRNEVVKKARLRAENLSRNIYNSNDFDLKYKKFLRLRDIFNQKHTELFKKVVGKNWKETIGDFLQNSRKHDYIKIEEQLDYEKYSFEETEFLNLKDIIFNATNLYKAFNINNLIALKEINKNLFKVEYSRLSSDNLSKFVKNKEKILSGLLEKINNLSEEDISIGKYFITDQQNLKNGIDFFQKIKNLLQESISTLNDYQDYTKYSEKELLKIKNIDIFEAFFNKRKKILNEKKTSCLLKIDTYNNIIDSEKESLIGLINFDETTNISSVLEKLNLLHEESNLIIEKIKNILKLNKYFVDEENILINDYDVFTKRKPINFVSIKGISEYKDYIEKEIVFFDSLKKEIHEYEPFYRWMFYLNKLNSNQKSLISSLCQYGVDDWLGAYTAWYLYGALINHESKIGSLNTSDEELKTLTDLYDQLKKEQKLKIRSDWDDNAKNQKNLYERKNGFNLLYNLRKNKVSDRANPLRRIIQSEFDLFTSIFPVILTNPVASDSVLPLKQGLFDVVIFDEASQLRIEDVFTSFIRGKYKVIAGDKHQMPPSSFFETGGVSTDAIYQDIDDMEISEEEMERQLASSESLLDYAENLPKKSYSYLDYHYRSKHPALIDFSNAAFYGGNLVPFPAMNDYSPIELVQVNGHYKNNINESEVKEVLRIISEDIHVKPDGTYPSVGIATFNLKQRNEIRDALDKFSSENEDFAKILDGIKESGLFIKNLENIQGDEMDIIIISTTYGKGDDGRFLERFGPVNYTKGYKLLNVLITRAKYKVYVCTSVPKEKYHGYEQIIESTGNNKKGIFYAYLAYSEAVSNGDITRVQSILESLKQNSHEAPRANFVLEEGLTESPFEQEVYEMLSEKFSKDQISIQHKIGGFRIDFVLNINEKKIAIECDGKTYHSSNEAYAHDMYRQKELKEMGFVVYRIWSTRWWHDHSKEMDNLVEFISKL